MYNHWQNTGYERRTEWREYELKRRAEAEYIDAELRRKLVAFYKAWGEWDELAEKCGWDEIT